MAWDAAGRMYASEFGQDTWDELNLIKAGANYGWPTVEGTAGRAGFTDPLVQWPTDDASPSGIAVGRDGDVYVAALQGRALWQVPVASGSAGTPRKLLGGTLRTAADGRHRPGRPAVGRSPATPSAAARPRTTTGSSSCRRRSARPADRGARAAGGGRGAGRRRSAARGGRPGRRRVPSRSGAELRQDERAHLGRVGLALHLLHDLADQRAGGLDLAVADLGRHVGVGGDDRVDRRRRARRRR